MSRSVSKSLVLGRERVTDLVPAPSGEPSHDPRLVGARALVHDAANLRVAQLLDALRDRTVEDLLPSRQQPERAERREVHVHPDDRRHRQRDDAAPDLRGPIGRAQLVRDAIGIARVDGEDVPVERTARRVGHLSHPLDLLVAEPVEAAVGDVLQGGAGTTPHHLAQREELVQVGMPRRYGASVTVVVRVGLRRREPEPPGRERLVQQLLHFGELVW
jgi:hypothetical protein